MGGADGARGAESVGVGGNVVSGVGVVVSVPVAETRVFECQFASQAIPARAIPTLIACRV
ncbi:hypothetical protein [Mycobacterium servetii]|uniref:Uncharacterized protein n=1 Tax=Mycobacterium servetii TaxID=3237418 RepID=A0ABV4BY81_9MYCO